MLFQLHLCEIQTYLINLVVHASSSLQFEIGFVGADKADILSAYKTVVKFITYSIARMIAQIAYLVCIPEFIIIIGTMTIFAFKLDFLCLSCPKRCRFHCFINCPRLPHRQTFLKARPKVFAQAPTSQITPDKGMFEQHNSV